MNAATAAAARELCRIGARLYARGHVAGSAGNLSLRLDDGSFLITPTDACLAALTPAALAHVAADGTPLAGGRASKTLALHRRIYDAAPDAGCVVHTHGPHLVALTLLGVWHPDAVVPPITPYVVMKVGAVPLIPYHRPGDPAVGDLVAARIAAGAARGVPLRAVMLDRLGPNAWHASPAAASAVVEELEETARLWLACGRAAAPLDAARLQELHEVFGCGW